MRERILIVTKGNVADKLKYNQKTAVRRILTTIHFLLSTVN